MKPGFSSQRLQDFILAGLWSNDQYEQLEGPGKAHPKMGMKLM
jgi:hypothetical protein